MRLIDADGLKEIIEYQQTINPKLSVYDVINLIDNVPTISPNMAQVLAYDSGKASTERPTGEWISINDKRGKEIVCKCSHCGKNPKYDVHSAYCPNCGSQMAKMKGDK